MKTANPTTKLPGDWLSRVLYHSCKLRSAIITLCGSTRFKSIFERVNKELTEAGYIVLADGENITEQQRSRLDELHRRKIDLSDMVLVLNCNGYIGKSTRSEMEYAQHRDIPVVYFELITDSINGDQA